jgi:hypothetical protein
MDSDSTIHENNMKEKSGRKKGTSNHKNKLLLLEFIKKTDLKTYDLIKSTSSPNKGSR